MVFDTRRQLPSRRIFNVSREMPKNPYLPRQRLYARVGRLMLIWLWAKRMWRYLAPETIKTPEQEADAYIANLRAASLDDVAAVLSAALIARKTLDTTRLVETPFPNDDFDGNSELDEAARDRLAAYADELRRFQATCATSGMTLGHSVAKGLDTWILTARALAMPHMLEKGREAWTLLKKGDDRLENSFRFMIRREITDVEREYLAYRPAALTKP